MNKEKELKNLKDLLKQSISISEKEKNNIYSFAKENSDKIDKIIDILNKEKIKFEKILNDYNKNLGV